MYRTATRNINSAQVVKETMFAPHPTTGYTIDNGVQQRKQTIGLKIASKNKQEFWKQFLDI